MKKISAITETATSTGEFTDGSVASGVSPTILSAAWFNTIQRELVAVVEGAGLTLDSANDNQILAALNALYEAKGSLLPLAGGIMTGEIQSKSGNALRFISGDYGFITRFDGANYYLMMTAKDDQSGTWNDLRPLSINAVTGTVTLSNTAVEGALEATGNITLGGSLSAAGNVYSGSAFITTDGNTYGTLWGGYLNNWLNANFVTSVRLGSVGTTTVTSSGYSGVPDGWVMVDWLTEGSSPGGDTIKCRPLQYCINGSWYTAGVA